MFPHYSTDSAFAWINSLTDKIKLALNDGDSDTLRGTKRHEPMVVGQLALAVVYNTETGIMKNRDKPRRRLWIPGVGSWE